MSKVEIPHYMTEENSICNIDEIE